MKIELTPEIAEKFWQRVSRGDIDECWPWTGAVTRYGYGQLYVPVNRYVRATHIAYQLAHGPIPQGKVVAHSCDNPNCVNAHHLKAMTQLENIADRNSKGRQDHGPHAPRFVRPQKRGQIRGERTARAKMTADSVREMRRRYAAGGISQRQLCKEYGLTHNAVQFILYRKSWKHVT